MLVDVLLLLDLRTQQVRSLPKVAWALIIVLVSFPVGGILYWFAGRASPHELDDARQTTTAATAREGNGQTQLPDRDIGWVPDRPLVLSTHGLRKVYDLPAVDGITAWTSTWPEHLRSKRP